jgi:hypothetical protein
MGEGEEEEEGEEERRWGVSVVAHGVCGEGKKEGEGRRKKGKEEGEGRDFRLEFEPPKKKV